MVFSEENARIERQNPMNVDFERVFISVWVGGGLCAESTVKWIDGERFIDSIGEKSDQPTSGYKVQRMPKPSLAFPLEMTIAIHNSNETTERN